MASTPRNTIFDTVILLFASTISLTNGGPISVASSVIKPNSDAINYELKQEDNQVQNITISPDLRTPWTLERPDAWRDFLAYSVESDSDAEGSGDYQLQDAEIFNSTLPINITEPPIKPAVSEASTSIPPNFQRSNFSDKPANFNRSSTTPVYDDIMVSDSSASTDENLFGQLLFGTVLGTIENPDKTFFGTGKGDDIITIWINLRTGQMVGSTISALEMANSALISIMGKERADYFTRRFGKGEV